jgi:hypothetical protein
VIGNVKHKIDPELVTEFKDEIKGWGYIMTQYNLQASLRKFREKGMSAAIKELLQLHIMNTWKAIESTKLSQEDCMWDLSSLLFLKEK